MRTITQRTPQLKLYGAVLVLTALVATVVAIAMAGGAQAQSLDNTYPDPAPCGPGALTASMEEPHEIRSGHFALFDAYWELTHRASNDDPRDTHGGIMHINECPPEMVKATEEDEGEVKTVITRTAYGIDISEAIMHVLDGHQVAVVATNAEATAGQLSLEEYPEVRRGLGLLGPNNTTLPVPAGTKVWWLRLDDPDTTDKDETSDLGMGFSAALFDSKYWLTSKEEELDDRQPMRYMFEAERYPGSDPAEVPHFYAYEAPKEGNAEAEIVWDSTRVHYPEQAMELEPGEYRPVQWIFTKAGTYEVSTNFRGFVRTSNPHQSGDDEYDANWKRISSDDTATTGEKTFTFQVGSELAETEPPMFGVNLRAHEDASAGDHVGEPIRVFDAEVPALTYTLSGKGHGNFSVTSRTHPNAAQIVVASGADLNYDSQKSYDLVLEVSDGKDHEGNDDDSVDHYIGVEIDLIQHPHVIVSASKHTPATGESVTLFIGVRGLPEGVAYSDLSYLVWENTKTGGLVSALFPAHDSDSPIGTSAVSHADAGTYKYTPEATYTLDGVEHTLRGDPVTITWRASSP